MVRTSKSIKGKIYIVFVFFTFIIVHFYSGCNIIENRDFINDGVRSKYELSSYASLDSIVNSFQCDTVITLERSGCLGECPVFKFALLSNSMVYFQGRHNVLKEGIFDTVFNKTELVPLVSEFYRSGFFQLREVYNLSNCVGPTDLSSVVISIKTKDIIKKVSFYVGCIDYNKEARMITGLAVTIENISNVKSWIR